MKYIDAEKLKGLVSELKERAQRNRYDSWGIVPEALEEVEGFITSLQQQPEVDLEKEIDEQWDRFVSSEGEREDFNAIARHFYELGLKARKEE